VDGRIVVRSSLCDSRAARLVDFSFADVAVSTSSGKQLVHSVSGDVRGGRSLAIMGPSGAGKTTLLNTMALEPGVGQRCSGNIALNGSPFTAKLCQQHCAYCRQHDDLWWALSAEEHLRFAIALLRRRADVDDEVKELLGSMGLESCANTRAGNTLFRGLSGGQKRRLSLALALAKDPAVIFLDEPTSGLDAAAASSIMAFLRQTARQWNVAMLCTIHQPSASVFAGFDECLILSSGRIAYLGVAARLSAHLDAIGKPVPPYTNPCEHMLELVNADFSEPATVDAVITAWQQRAPPLVAPLKADLPSPRRGNLCRETRRLLRRHSLLIVRDPTLYVGRMAAFMAAGCFFAIIYIKAREREQDQVLNRVFFLLWLGSVPSMLGAVAVFALNVELRQVGAEIRDGLYSPFSYLIANTLIQLPLLVLLAVCAILVPGYAVGNLDITAFPKMLAIFAAFLWSFECIAQAMAILTNPLVGLLAFLDVWFIAFLFNGLLIQADDVIWPFKLCFYVLPYRHFITSILYNEFVDGPTFSGVLPCNASAGGLCAIRGFYCPADPTGLSCYGREGVTVLNSLKVNYRSISTTDTFEESMLIILAIALYFKLSFAVMLLATTRGGKEPQPAGKGPARIGAAPSAAAPSRAHEKPSAALLLAGVELERKQLAGQI